MKYLSGKAALDYWEVPGIKGVLEPAGAYFPLEYVIFTEKSFHRPNGCILHSCRIKDADKYVSGNVCTLPLVFLQLANVYSIQKLIYLGLQICSLRSNGTALSTVKELFECAVHLKGHRGRRKALRALRYMANESRSPRESMLYMFLRLPNALGGCGFRQLQFNKKLPGKGNSYYYADIYHEKKKLVIEYDSYQNHNNSRSFSEDTIRAANLESRGYQVMQIRTTQLSELSDFETVAKNIARRIGKKLRIRARKFFDGFVKLREILRGKGKRNRPREIVVQLHEVPNFRDVPKTYKIYYEHWKPFYRPPTAVNKYVRKYVT